MNTELYGTRLYIKESSLEYNVKYVSQNNNNMIAMVKANAYGHGDIMMTKKMEQLGINFFGVADFEEGLALRKSGVKSTIIVMNPGINNVRTIINEGLEIVVYNTEILRQVISFAKEKNKTDQSIRIHIKINTGMNRWGFCLADLSDLIAIIKSEKSLKVASIYSHLSSAHNKKDDNFTMEQIDRFLVVKSEFSNHFRYKIHSHIFNSKGWNRFRNKISSLFSHSRIGIALYGGFKHLELKPISELKCSVSQIRNIGPNEYVGYNNNFISKKNLKIGIIPFGYADGLQRNWGNGVLRFYYKGKFLPTIGEISMDSCVIDLSGVFDISVGDDVLYFGSARPIWNLANELNTIPYEIMATLSRRIKRVYI